MTSNHTEKYKLSQWEKSDKILMEDFNSDNHKIEDALASLAASKAEQSEVDKLSSQVASALSEIPKFAMGTYQGTGKYGAANPNSLTFPFKPKLVLLMGDPVYALFLEGNRTAKSFSGTTTSSFNVTWNGATMSWYVTYANSGGANYALDAGFQMNSLNATYKYFIIG